MRRHALTLRVLMPAIAAAAIAALSPHGAAALAQRGDAFKSGVDLVTLSVTVTDVKHNVIGGLEEKDFLVFEDGVRQDLSFFAFNRLPLDLAILLDTSSSMTRNLHTAQRAAVGFVETLEADDRITVIEVHGRADILHPLSADIPGAIDAIRRTSPHGATALYNALYLAMTEMGKQRRSAADVRRQAIVVLSDGVDTASLVQYDDVMALAKESGIAIYTILLTQLPDEQRAAMAIYQAFLRPQPQFVMRSLAHETGGRSFFPSGAGELDGIYGAIARELVQQYMLAYVPKNTRRDGAFRHVVVRVVGRTDTVARTRTGYQAARAR